ncbi:hypothetical protein [Micromonospora auratinigra]|uniref:Uncharacterized protein n=1 Tax=Micromonospora auratinigra TaxID=261654 RepID=A0A1A8ZV49_9ACTN|nr:hypothetical protein [Micromonospora auratinigra]SBT47992.1 hypothetical protein GA0070611_3919 [Micromonospora auratinigra]
MSEQENHALLAEQLGRYRATAIAEVEVPGPAAVRRTVRRNHRRTLAAAVVSAVALLTGPAVGYAAFDRDPAPRPVEPTLSPTPGPSLSPTPTSSPTVAGHAPPAPDGRISRKQLLAARVDLPAWRSGNGCASTDVRLVAERGNNTVTLYTLAYGDVDGDGATETVALVQCVDRGFGSQQVVAFDRNTAGAIVTLGRVVRTARETPQWLIDLDVRADGVVRVRVGDIAPGGGWPGDWSQRQWRGYRWDGEQFRQAEGPTTFGPNPYSTDLAVTASDLVLRPDADGSQVGTIEVRLRNLGDRVADNVDLSLDLPPSLVADGGGWAGCRPDMPRLRPPSCLWGSLGPHAEVTLRLGVRLPPNVDLTPGRALVKGTALGPDLNNLLDPDFGNNEDTIGYR